MKTLLAVSLMLLSMIGAFASEAAPLLYLAGDSTMAQKPMDVPECGWGMALSGFFKDAAMVQNHAVNGRSTKSFINEGRWDRMLKAVQHGDYVVIQFGHNDEKVESPNVGTQPQTEFRANLRRFIEDVRAKGAIPILATPIARRHFDESGKLTPTHGVYPEVVRSVAKEAKVALLDLEKSTSEWLAGEGDEPSKRFFMWIAPGVNPKIPDGKKDDTHLVEAGALKVAELAVAEIRAQKLPLADWVK